MSLGDQIRGIRERTLNELADAHDYYEYTDQLRRTLHILVKRKGFEFTLRNRTTKSTFNQDDLISRGPKYSQALAVSTLQQFVSIFEAFLTDVIRQWLKRFPKSLASSTLTLGEILPIADKESVVDFVIERRLRDLFYGRPDHWFVYLRDLTKIAAPQDADASRFAELKAARDVLVHNQGIANLHYETKAGAAARATAGARLTIEDRYHQASWELICRLVREVSDQMFAKAGSN